MRRAESYTAASKFPTKLLHNTVMTPDRKIIPLHVQVYPTNACNQACSFCSCKDRDTSLSIPYDTLVRAMDVLMDRGTRAMTVSGGGEPLLYGRLDDLIRHAARRGVQVGLTTNGVALGKLRHHPNLRWVRISCSDEQDPLRLETVQAAMARNPGTDWGFSYVLVGGAPDYAKLHRTIDFANRQGCSHVRVVSNLLDLQRAPKMEVVRKELRARRVRDRLVIYQGRKVHRRGARDCYLSLLKPLLAPEGVFPCCGVQYATAAQPRDLIQPFKMGGLEDLEDILRAQRSFGGRVCQVCYYGRYNDALRRMVEVPAHKEFV